MIGLVLGQNELNMKYHEVFKFRILASGLPTPLTHPKGRLLHSKFDSALFKQYSEGPHFWFIQFLLL